MLERNTSGDFIRIRCDKCNAPSPPTKDLIINHGLIGMGWKCSGGTHVCPDCKEPTV